MVRQSVDLTEIERALEDSIELAATCPMAQAAHIVREEKARKCRAGSAIPAS